MRSERDPQPADGGSDIAGQLEGLQDRLFRRLADVKTILAVMSGKGGVGKSTVTANLAAELAHRGLRIGVVDGDLYGPSLARLLGVTQQTISWQSQGAIPAETSAGVKLMSMALMLPAREAPLVWQGSQEAGFTWKGNLEMHALREFIGDTDWGPLDVLVVDLPPGTNQFATLCELLDRPAKTLAVTIPSELANEVVTRSLTMAKHHLPSDLIGLAVNMAGYFCQDCNEVKPLFGGASIPQFEWDPPLAYIPFDPRMTTACDQGVPFVRSHPQTPTARAIIQLANKVMDHLQIHTQSRGEP